ncbi:MAG: helix-turn-helix transcriptional regulator [Clostridia bacterium]|nr:helix-turn-helix transcriptional regulator [Clostridia bacterium]
MYAERIRMLRQQAGLSQQSLGQQLGVSAVAVGKWERGQTQPDIHSLTRMADIFRTTIDDLCGHEPRVSVREEPEGNIRVMTRAFRQLTQDEQEKYIAVGRALFAHAFDAADGKDVP